VLFHGREQEIELILKLTKKKAASLVVLRGRRRIGKSSLAEHIGKAFNFLEFAGLPPEENITAQKQREIFAQQLQRMLKIPLPRADDWGNLFLILSNNIPKKQTILLLDEITWMGSKDPTFLGNLKTCWDQMFKQHNKLILIISGSASGWIENNILASTGFMGRISLDLVLEELPLNICVKFWGKFAKSTSSYEKLKYLAVTGGVPRYLEELYPDESSIDNIQRLCFTKSGFLFTEFEKIFSDLFDKRAPIYKNIVTRLADGPAYLEDIYAALDSNKSGTIIDYVEDLIACGFVRREHTWSIVNNGRESKLSKIRLSDNYLRFYLYYIQPHKARIENNNKIDFNYSATILGLQFENLILANREKIHNLLDLKSNKIIANGPYFQKTTKRIHGCQIDYLIQTKENILYICEVKFSRDKIGSNVIAEMQAKIGALNLTKGYSYRTVLIHVNGMTDDLIETEFFSYSIDFAQFL